MTQSADIPNAAGRIIAVTLSVSIAYAVLRYHLVGSVPWQEFPLFILNKGLCLAAFILLGFNFSLGPLQGLGVRVPPAWLNARKALGMMAFLLVLIHVLMSVLLFSPANYGKFFNSNGSVALMAGLAMLFGVLGFVFLWAYNLSFQTFLREDAAFIAILTSRRTMNIALVLGGLHLFFMGYRGWLQPADWQGGLPPISLVAFAFFAVGYLINIVGRE